MSSLPPYDITHTCVCMCARGTNARDDRGKRGGEREADTFWFNKESDSNIN